MKTKSRKNKVDIITLGCSKNIVDSEVMMAQLRANDIEVTHEKNDDSNIIIINTCGFIERAKEESIQAILDYAGLKRDGGIEKLYVTGCLSHRYKNELEAEIPEVDAWFGTMELPSLLHKFGAEYKHELIGERKLITPPHYAYLKISEGCNRTCAFCAIPLMRGKHVSKPIDEIINEAKNLLRNGVKEIILIAQELTYYGLDIYKERKLAELLKRLSDMDGVEWIRLHYAYPSKFPLEILDVMKERKNICNYLDMPLQHISDAVLSRMKRQITRQEILELIQSIKNKIPDITLRTTMLVGFPGETKRDFEELKEFVIKTKFDRLGVFTYSQEEGTSGAELTDDVPQETKEKRMAELMALQQEISLEHNKEKIGREYKILIDRKEGGYFVGRTEGDSPEVDNEVLIEAGEFFCRTGDFVNARITDAEEFDLYADVINN